MSAAALLSVFLIALLGGVHCLAMCSGIALAAERAQPAVRIVSRRRLWFEQLVMHLGRLTTYALLGAAMGALGATVWRQQWLPIQRGLFALASALLLAYGLLLLSRTAADVWRGAWLERILGRLSGGLAAVASGVRASSLRARFPLAGRYLTGLAWGLVPCGMVYGALAVALLAGNAASGAVVMLAFGAGTLPNLLMMSAWPDGCVACRGCAGLAVSRASESPHSASGDSCVPRGCPRCSTHMDSAWYFDPLARHQGRRCCRLCG